MSPSPGQGAPRETERSVAAADGQQDLRALLEFIHDARGFNFSGYKKSSLERRLLKRIGELRVDSYSAYQDYLEANPHEFEELFNTILINVTSFFRDAPAWKYLSEEVVPRLVSADSEVLRVWSAGCATGEEAYTVVMLLAEALGEDEFRKRVKIYATDVDDDALARARHAVYGRDAVKNVPPELLERYFEETPRGWTFRPDLRRSVIFGRNDLVQDAPISRVDLLVSRNALMYFTAEAQSRILERFNFALSERGFLFLGKSEMLITNTALFTPYNLKWRVFRKVPRIQLRDRLGQLGGNLEFAPLGSTDRYPELRGGAFAVSTTPQVLVSHSGFVVDINLAARELFGCKPSDIGSRFQDLAISYQPVDLRTAIERAYAARDPVSISRVPWTSADGEERTLEIEVRVVPGEELPLGVAISFNDITAVAKLADENDERKHELEMAYEELQSTVEELETTNEELQSTNEELETTNEELQSTNEELETMNEELQSTNDELEVMNTEQAERSSELDRVNLFLEGILTSLGVGVVVLDRSRRVQVWNGESTELWGVRAEEADGRALDELDIGLPVQEIQDILDSAMGHSPRPATRELEAVNRRGRKFMVSVRVLPLVSADGDVSGALLLMGDSNRNDGTELPGL